MYKTYITKWCTQINSNHINNAITLKNVYYFKYFRKTYKIKIETIVTRNSKEKLF